MELVRTIKLVPWSYAGAAMTTDVVGYFVWEDGYAIDAVSSASAFQRTRSQAARSSAAKEDARKICKKERY